MATSPTARKARFLAALRIAGTTMDAWAKDRGVSQGYVSNLIAGRRDHPELLRQIDAFATRHLCKVSSSA